MKKIFLEKQIEINALPPVVWDVLTKRPNTGMWSHEFSPERKFFFIESEWSLGDPVYWKCENERKDDQEIILEGRVMAVELNRLLRFTAFDKKRSENIPVFTEDDGITFEITQVNGHCILHVRQGDFGVMADGERYRELYSAAWDRALVKIKLLAEKKITHDIYADE